MRQKIVISAVNLNKGGTLTILRDCLSYLSNSPISQEFEIVVLVFDKDLAYYPNITYIETKWPKQRWINRLWYEYVSMNKISKELGNIYLWFSLHDTSPTVKAERKAVYAHNSFSFYKWKWKELFYDPKIVLFAWFTKYIYKTNIHKNNYIVVQQEWFRKEFVQMFGLAEEKIVVAPPERKSREVTPSSHLSLDENQYSFLYPAYSNSNKNFEVIFDAVAKLEAAGIRDFQVNLTINGQENKYTQMLYQKYAHLQSIQWLGFLSREDLYFYYQGCDALIFASKMESWGLPISEFLTYDKPMLLADLAYAHEASAGAKEVVFFNADQSFELVDCMKQIIKGDKSHLKSIPPLALKEPIANNWQELFLILLNDKK